MTRIVLGGLGEQFTVVPVEWPNPRYGVVDNLAADVANDFERSLGGGFNSGRFGFRLLHHLHAVRWDELAGLFLWTGEPLLPPVLVTLEEYEAVGEAAEVAQILGHADDPGLGVEQTAVEHPRLGPGTRFLRRVRRRRFLRSTVRHEVRWVWRLGGHDVVVTFERDDPEEFDRILPDVEDLVVGARRGDG